MKRVGRWLALLVGLGFLGWYLARADLESVGDALGRLGWAAPLLLAPYLIVYVIDTWAWRYSFATTPGISFGRMFRIRWCGESVNNVVPSAYIGGEAVKVLLLREEGVPVGASTGAALISKTAQTLAQVIFLIGATVAMVSQGGEDTDRAGLVPGLVGMLVAGGGGVAVLLWAQRRGFFGILLRLADRLGLRSRRVDARRARILAVDAEIARFHRRHPGRFLAATGIFLAGWLADTLEVYLAGWLLGWPITWSQAWVIEGFTGVIKIAALWIPGALGVQESGIVVLARLTHAPAGLGAVYALIRRVREVVFATMGWLLLYASAGRTGSPKAWMAGLTAGRSPGSRSDE